MEAKPEFIVAPVSPKVPNLRSERLESWFIRCEAMFSTSKITVGKTRVEYCVGSNAIPEEILDRMQQAMAGVYSDDDPWAAFKTVLRGVLCVDPSSVISRISSDSLDATSGLLRHAELSRMLDSVSDLRETIVKWSVLRLIPVEYRESFDATHKPKGSYEYAREIDLFRSRHQFTPDTNSISSSSKSLRKKKWPLCHFHKKFGSKALRCDKHPDCPPLKSVNSIPEVNNISWTSPFDSSDSE